MENNSYMGNKDYIGEGVYVEYDGYSIWLKTGNPDNPTSKICLEPHVLNALINFRDRTNVLKDKELGGKE